MPTPRPTIERYRLEACEWEVRDYISKLLALLDDREGRITTLEEKPSDPGEVSDGYHTFNELYAHRCMLFLALMASHPSLSWFSQKHDDGSEWEGWFIAGMELPTGDVTYHLPIGMLDAATQTGARQLDAGKEWDGHSPSDVVVRLGEWVRSSITKLSITTLNEELNRTNIVADKLREEMSAVCDHLGLVLLEDRTLAGILEAIGSLDTTSEQVATEAQSAFSDPDFKEAVRLATDETIANGAPPAPSLDDPAACGRWMRDHGSIAKARAKASEPAMDSAKPVGRKPRTQTEAEAAAVSAHYALHGVTKVRELGESMGITHAMAHRWLQALQTPNQTTEEEAP